MPVKDARAFTIEIIKRMNEDERRLRMLEQRMEKVENGVNSLEENILGQTQTLKISLEKLSNKISSVVEKITSLENNVEKLRRGLQKAVTKTELKQIETFIDFMNPVTSKFVTKDELERALEYQKAKDKVNINKKEILNK